MKINNPVPKALLWRYIFEDLTLTKIQRQRAISLANSGTVELSAFDNVAIVGPRRDTKSEHAIQWNETQEGINWIECKDKLTKRPCNCKLGCCTHIAALARVWMAEEPNALVAGEIAARTPNEKIIQNGTLLPFVTR